MAIGGFFLSESWTKITKIEKDVVALQLVDAKNNLFTYAEWKIEKDNIMTEKLISERRLYKLEENVVVIKDSLIKIQNMLEKNENK